MKRKCNVDISCYSITIKGNDREALGEIIQLLAMNSTGFNINGVWEDGVFCMEGDCRWSVGCAFEEKRENGLSKYIRNSDDLTMTCIELAEYDDSISKWVVKAGTKEEDDEYEEYSLYDDRNNPKLLNVLIEMIGSKEGALEFLQAMFEDDEYEDED